MECLFYIVCLLALILAMALAAIILLYRDNRKLVAELNHISWIFEKAEETLEARRTVRTFIGRETWPDVLNDREILHETLTTLIEGYKKWEDTVMSK